MADIESYARTEAEKYCPPQPGVAKGAVTRAQRRLAYGDGIKHLASVLLTEEAVTAAARRMQRENRPENDMLNRDQREAVEDETFPSYQALAQSALSAALDTIIRSTRG